MTRLRPALAIVLAGGALLAACASEPRSTAATPRGDPAAAALPANKAPPVPAAEAAVPSAPAITDDKARPPSAALEAARYQCTDGSTITARYEDNAAMLTKGQESWTLQGAVSASGARYVGQGRQWWTVTRSGVEQATLAQLKPGETYAQDTGLTCTRRPAAR
jgi:membrane-bound inhibitor of C-type lysozyme